MADLLVTRQQCNTLKKTSTFLSLSTFSGLCLKTAALNTPGVLGSAAQRVGYCFFRLLEHREHVLVIPNGLILENVQIA